MHCSELLRLLTCSFTMIQNVANKFSRTLLGLVSTGLVFLTLGFVLWFAYLAAEAIFTFIQLSSHMHQPSFRPAFLLSTDGGVAVAYGTAFFVAALIMTRFSWCYRPVLSAFSAYMAFLATYLSCLELRHEFFPDTFILILPLITSLLGGFLGERLFARTKIT